jgi:hypothetical protein
MRGVGPFRCRDQVTHVLGALHDLVDAGHRCIEPLPGTQVSVDVFDVVAAVTTPASAEDAHVCAGREELIDHDLAQSAGAAGHKYEVSHTLWTG